jgi:hypothetical protein
VRDVRAQDELPRSGRRCHRQAAPYFTRYGDAFILQLKANVGYLEEDFAQIQRIDYKRPFEECLTLAEIIIDAAMGR